MNNESTEVLNTVESDNTVLDPQPRGIGGWLILIILGYVISVFRILYHLNQALKLISNETFQLLKKLENVDNIPTLSFIIKYEIAINVILLIAIIMCLIMMFRKKKTYPLYAIGFIIASSLFFIVDIILLKDIGIPMYSTTDSQIVARLLSSTIWIAYFNKSKRVKNTFVN